MVRPMAIHVGHEQYFCSTPLAIGLFISITVLVALCAQHSRKPPRKYTNSPSPRPPSSSKKIIADTTRSDDKSHDHPLINPTRSNNIEESEVEKMYNTDHEEEEGRLWQKAILMGEKCQPPEFSGALFYDSYGNRVTELPRSPRVVRTPVRNFSASALNTQ